MTESASPVREKRTICVDFDGVLHSYTSPWTHRGHVPDRPVDGALDFLRALLNAGLEVVVFSVRCNDLEGRSAIERWLLDWGLEPWHVEKLRFEAHKPRALVYIDDRGYRFEGTFPSVEELLALKPWNRR